MRFAPLMLTAILGLWPVLVVAAGEVTPLYTSDFPAAGYGHAPPGWRDLIDRRPSRNWASSSTTARWPAARRRAN